MIISNQGRSILIRQSIPEDAKILFQAYSDESFIRLYRSNNPAQSEEQLFVSIVPIIPPNPKNNCETC